jgi:hypothetical protein
LLLISDLGFLAARILLYEGLHDLGQDERRSTY